MVDATILSAFIADATGQCLDLDGAYGCQCVDLADAWANQLGHPLPLVMVAADFIGQNPTGWRWVANAADNAPAPGDLVIWDTRIGFAGHVDLCIGPSSTASFVGLDQNWFNSSDHGSPAAVVTHNYYGVAGWLTPTTTTGGGATPMPQTPFYVNTHADARWYAQPDGPDMGSAASLTNLKIVETASDGTTPWYRWEGGTWWLNNTQCDVVAPPPPAPPPATDLEARVARLEAKFAAVDSALRA